MERNAITFLCLLAFLILHNGQLTKAVNGDCPYCNDDEFCVEDECHKIAEARRDYNYDYVNQRRDNREDSYRRSGGLDDQGTKREDIPQPGYLRENAYDSSEPTLEDRTLIKSLPLPENNNDYRPEVDTRSDGKTENERLPPSTTENWDKIGTRNVNGGELHNGINHQGRGQNDYQTLENEEDSFQQETSPSRGSKDSLPSLNEDSKIWDPLLEDSGSRKNKLPPVPLDGSSHRNRERLDSGNDAALDSTKAKILINGEVKGTHASIDDQGPNPEKKYDRVKDFFKSQQASSIVYVPKAVKREEEAKLFDTKYITVEQGKTDEVYKEEDSSSSKRGALKISLDKNITRKQAMVLLQILEKALWINPPKHMFDFLNVDGQTVKARVSSNDYSPENEKDVAKRMNEDGGVKDKVARQMNVHILSAEQEDKAGQTASKPKKKIENGQPKFFLLTVVVVGCVTGVILAAVAIYLIMKRHNETKKFKPVSLPGQEAAADYQELCRQLRANQGWDGGQVKTGHVPHVDKDKGLLGSSKPPKYTWSEEPVVPNMDISTGHVVLAYMEDHLNNKNRLNKEWEALCSYEAEPNSTEIGKTEKNVRKNRYSDVLPYDHNRVSLRETANATGSDYANASFITDHDPRNPAYIATQGPLAHTVSDFWQMVWEQGVVVIVNLTRLSDLGLPQCHRYWPDDGHVTYHIYEVHLVSEHIWCDDYLVRSFYLKNLQTSETRTVTQFHFLSWPDLNVPTSPKPLLEFRRKVNKCFRGRSCPIVVHCSGGVGRTGCYILIDMVLNKMMRGAKEIDIAATVEHLRDQRPHMVKTKAQFEFALTAVAEEVSAILQALAK